MISAVDRQSGGEDGCYREKFRNYIARAEPDKKQHFFEFLWYLRLSRTQPTGNMESRDSEGVPFASQESL